MKILKFNELAGTTYLNVMDRTKGKGDPRSFRLYADAKRLRSEYYSKEPLKILVSGDADTIDFKIDDIILNAQHLILTTSKHNKQHLLKFNIGSNDLVYEAPNEKIKDAYIDRKGARIICKILKDYGFEVKPQDIPHL